MEKRPSPRLEQKSKLRREYLMVPGNQEGSRNDGDMSGHRSHLKTLSLAKPVIKTSTPVMMVTFNKTGVL